jgi:GrxC family glutaredoxin
MAKKVTVYTMDYCPYCERAKALLKTRGIAYQEVRVAEDDEQTWKDLYERSGMRTMPQIYADDELVGGYTDLAEKDSQDQLASLK